MIKAIMYLLIKVFLVDLLIFAVVAWVCWPTDNESGYGSLASGLFIAGALVMIIGMLSFSGSAGRSGRFDNYYKSYGNSEDTYKRILLNEGLIGDSYNFVLVSALAGGILLLIAYLIS
jgi:hypothetical protein